MYVDTHVLQFADMHDTMNENSGNCIIIYSVQKVPISISYFRNS